MCACIFGDMFTKSISAVYLMASSNTIWSHNIFAQLETSIRYAVLFSSHILIVIVSSMFVMTTECDDSAGGN